jgi:hypothetical protein
MGFNGRVLRLWDATRGWMRVFLDFDLETILAHPHAFLVFWAIARAEALATHTRAVAIASDRYGHAVRSSLRDGVRDELERHSVGIEHSLNFLTEAGTRSLHGRRRNCHSDRLA